MNFPAQRIAIAVCLIGMLTTAAAQFRRPRRPPSAAPDRGTVPVWTARPGFANDVFTFARIKYNSTGWERSSYAWWTDYPDADFNLSYRLQELTALKVSPDPVVVEITNPALFRYPWVFMSGAGNIILDETEAVTLRRYLLNGGFMMVDDFWGAAEWDGFYRAIKQVFPNREPVDLPRSHPIFHCIFDLPDDFSLQTPNMPFAMRHRGTGITWEDDHEGGDTHDLHFRAIFDDAGRMMVMICHNTDNGDGWEEEGSDPWFFSTFSEKKNYPLAINIIFYAMTH